MAEAVAKVFSRAFVLGQNTPTRSLKYPRTPERQFQILSFYSSYMYPGHTPVSLHTMSVDKLIKHHEMQYTKSIMKRTGIEG